MTQIINYIRKQEMRPVMALGIIGFALTYLLLITFCKIPKENHDLVTLSFGWVTGAATTVICFYFGSMMKGKPNPTDGQ